MPERPRPLFPRVGMVKDIGEAELDIPGRLRQPLAEVGERRVIGEGVVLQQPGNALRVDLRRKKLRQRGATASSSGFSRTKET